MKKVLKKIIYYILLTIAFLILPFSIRNVYLSILIKESFINILIQIVSSLFIFLYPFFLALVLRHNIKYNKWLFIDDIDEEDDIHEKRRVSRNNKK